jgi:hypothetical protein
MHYGEPSASIANTPPEKTRALPGAAVRLLQKLSLPDGHLLGRYDFLPHVPMTLDLLEIGPGQAPCFRGDNVQYFDVLDAAALRQRAKDLNVQEFGQSADDCPEYIHYVSPTADMKIVNRKYDFVFSSHAVEHQVDLISHLQIVSGLLHPGGAYLIICPDRRYCFDANRTGSSLGQVIETHEFKRARHSLTTLIDTVAYPSHNDGIRHWRGDTPGVYRIDVKAVTDAVSQWRDAEVGQYYIDRHAWLFTSDSFRLITQFLVDANYIDLFPSRVFDVPENASEFIAVLAKPVI